MTDTENEKQIATPRVDEVDVPVVVTTKRRRRMPVVLIIVAAIILCAAAGFGGVKLYYELMGKNTGEVAQRQTPATDGNSQVTQEEEVIAGVVEKVAPSVVSIVTSSQTTSTYGVMEEEGAGSGIIVSADGYILTNKHVVSDTRSVTVVLHDGTTYEDVEVLGTDPLNDIAFLKINGASNLVAAELGDSSSVRVGQKVVAIGNSLGQYQNTVTSGIISGTGRPISAQAGSTIEHLTDLLQTDAAINPGNSGGPLLNQSGQVIGINTAIVEDAQGIGFAIPVNATKGMLKSVLEGKGVERAYLGVTFIPITANTAKEYDLSVKTGAYVYNGNEAAVVAGSPADKAGVKDKDIITKVGNLDVGKQGGVSSLVAEYAPGDTIELTILRGAQTITLQVTLAAYQS